MANALYNKGRQRFATADLDWIDDTIKVVAIDQSDYTMALTHEFLSSIPSAAFVSAHMPLANKTATDGVVDADDVVFVAVSGDSIEAVVIYKDTGDPATSPLIAYLDQGTGLPITPNGGDITLSWDNGVYKIFRL